MNSTKDRNCDLTFWQLGLIDEEIFESANVSDLIAYYYDQYDFGALPRKLFWQHLASAMLILKDQPNPGITEIDPRSARSVLKNVDVAIETILDLLNISGFELDQNSMDYRFSKNEAERAQDYVVSQGIRELARNHIQQSHNKGLLPAIDNPIAPFFSTPLVEELVSLRTKVVALNRAQNNRKRGPKSLASLSTFCFCLLDFWRRVAGKNYSRTRVTHEGGEAGERVTMKSTRTRFMDFCRDCLVLSGHEATESQISTAVENAIKMYEGKKPGISVLKVREISAD